MNVEDIPVPPRMQKFRKWRGFPIHYTVLVEEDGTPNFKSMHEHRRMECFQKNLCHLCGEPLGKGPYWFIGGPLCVTYRRFVDGAMHEDCARYACKACPFLANPVYRAQTATVDEPGGKPTFSDKKTNIRPPMMALVCVGKFTVGKNVKPVKHDPYNGGSHATNPFAVGQYACVVEDIKSVEWDLMPKSSEPVPIKMMSFIPPDFKG